MIIAALNLFFDRRGQILSDIRSCCHCCLSGLDIFTPVADLQLILCGTRGSRRCAAAGLLRLVNLLYLCISLYTHIGFLLPRVIKCYPIHNMYRRKSQFL